MSVRREKRRDPETGAEREFWFVDVDLELPGGRRKRVRKVAPVQTRRGAEEYERQLRGSLLDGSHGREEQLQQVPTVAEFEPRFLTYAENNNKPSTVTAKKQALKHHILPAFGGKRLNEIGPADIEAFKASMRRKVSQSRGRKKTPTKWAIKKRYGAPAGALSDKSINNTLSILRKMLGVAVEWGIIDHVPRMKLFKTQKPTFDFLDFDEAGRLVEAAEPEWRPALLLGIKAGLRIGEIIGLQWADLDLVRGRINVRRTIWRGNVGTPKGGRSRTVDIPPSLVLVLKKARHLNGPFVLAGRDSGPMTEGQLKAPLERALRKSGISREEGRIGWHDLRHTYGSHLAMKGVPLKVIQELMGHASIEMTMKYAHLSPETKKTAVLVLDEKLQDYGNLTATETRPEVKLP